ncbi:MAG TPA: VWA domain-containing protein [Candidatus Hydrogenedentes bacterium]|nr:VWA domain-containing protein [Candidatus Hydrogenedentota bacterium]HOL75794.1 VWA domain-containing protein [Candidatus Hydrogenedentota bacterium]HPO84212.1 VWA domain-containing protein [Candidatus Hydrogenedentota bacterium]
MTLINAFYFQKLMYPGFLAMLPGVIALCFAECLARVPSVLTISSLDIAQNAPRGKRVYLRHLPPIFRAIGLALLIVALSRPLGNVKPHVRESDAIDVMLCVDVSGSMRAVDFMEGGRPRDRLYVTKLAVKDFIQSRKFRPEDRYGLDRLGLILYAGYAWTQCPLTFDYGVLEREIDRASIDYQNPAKNGTAIGSAIGLAVSRLSKSEAKSRIIILLTDGRNNRGELDPLTAAQIAKDYGIKIYTIGAGSKDEVLVPVETPFGERYRRYLIPIDEDLLKKIADMTGGKYYSATDTDALKAAYEEINQLEKTPVVAGSYYDYEEKFLPWAFSGTLLLVLSTFTKRIWFDALP